MAGVLHFLLFVFLHCGIFILISARPDHDTTTVDSDAAFTTTRSLFSAGKTTVAPTTGFPAGYSKSPTKPPKTNTATERLTKTAKKAVSRKDTEEEEGPLELGEWVFFDLLHFWKHNISVELCSLSIQ